MILFWNKYHVCLQQLIKDSWFSLSRDAHSKQPGLETVVANDDVSPRNKKKYTGRVASVIMDGKMILHNSASSLKYREKHNQLDRNSALHMHTTSSWNITIPMMIWRENLQRLFSVYRKCFHPNLQINLLAKHMNGSFSKGIHYISFCSSFILFRIHCF